MKGSLGTQLAVPAAHFFILFALGIYLSDSFPIGSGSALIATTFTLGCAIIAQIGPVRRRIPTALKLTFFSCAIICAGTYRGGTARNEADPSLLPYADSRERCLVEGTVVATPARARERMSFQLETRSVTAGGAAHAVCARTMVFYSKSAFRRGDTLCNIRLGDTLRIDGALRSVRPARNPGAFDARLYYRRQGICTVLSAAEGSRVRLLSRPQTTYSLLRLADVCSAYLRDGIRELFAGEDADIMVGLVLGERGDIDEDVNRAFRDAGVIHILAVSGLHVVLILTFVWIPLGRVPFVPRVIVALAVLWLYSVMTGLIAPVVRAAVMATVFLVGRALQRVPHTMNAIGVAGIAVLVISPMELFSPSFQLSFAAVFAIVAFHGRCVRWMRKRLLRGHSSRLADSLVSTLAMTLTAQAGTLPFILSTFRQFSVVSFAANLAVVPLCSAVMAAGIPAAVFSGLGPFPSHALAETATAALDVTVWISRVLAGLPFSVVWVRDFPFVSSVIYTVACLYIFSSPARVRHRMCLALLSLACWVTLRGFGVAPETAGRLLRVTFLDVGQGDAVLVEFPGGRTLLVDAGPLTERFDTGERVLVPFLRSRGISRIDALVLTHPDNDHIGGAGSVLGSLDVGRVYSAGQWGNDPLQRSVDSMVRREGTTIQEGHAGGTIALDTQARVYLLSPGREASRLKASNGTSVVLKIVFGSTSFLLTGDAEEEAEAAMARRYADFLRSDVYKVGHHGSLSSTSPSFLAAVHPRHAVISCGRLNKFRHPRPETLARLTGMGVDVQRTDIAGCIMMESDGKNIRAIHWREGEE